ncbi:MAG: DUF6491 family protein [Pseudomonadota bacterium]
MRALLPLAAAFTLAGCSAYAQPVDPLPAQATAGGGRNQCFYAANVTGFRQGPGDIIYVNTNARDYYELRTLGYCAARLDFENRIALRSRGGGFICSGNDAEIFVPDALGSTYCPVRSNRKLSPQEVATLRAQKK